MPENVKDSLRRWSKRLPYSKMEYPSGIWSRVKYLFWRGYTPLHPYLRDLVVAVGLLKHNGRQPFLIGTVASDTSIKSFIQHLIDIGYGNHFVAWHDRDELVSVRITDGFSHQYHVRVFADGAVHGHYEYTPEAHPILHIKEVGFENRTETFREQFGEKLVAATAEETAASTRLYYDHWHPRSRAAKASKAKQLEDIAHIAVGLVAAPE